MNKTAMRWLSLCLGLVGGCEERICVGGTGSSGDCDDGGADNGSEGEGEGECTPHPLGGPAGDGVGCAFQCNDPEAPDFRISHLRWTAPAAFESLQEATDAGLDSFFEVDEETVRTWLVATRTDGRFTTGSGRCDPPARVTGPVPAPRCRVDDPSPASGTWRHDPAGGAFRLPEAGEIDLGLTQLFGYPSTGRPCAEACGGQGGWPNSLPLRSLSLTGTVSHDANCIGARTNASRPSEWETGGVLVAMVTVEDASDLIDGPMSLCDFIASGGVLFGAGFGYCDDHPDLASWAYPPDTDVDGEPAWTVTADFAAIGVVIDEP